MQVDRNHCINQDVKLFCQNNKYKTKAAYILWQSHLPLKENICWNHWIIERQCDTGCIIASVDICQNVQPLAILFTVRMHLTQI